MQIDAVANENFTIQPTWHCLLRFRQRARPPAGADAAVEALRASLARADIARVPPGWLAGREAEAEMWAVDRSLAFPLSRGAGGVWIATTCLVR
jgi:hypothetical protein